MTNDDLYHEVEDVYEIEVAQIVVDSYKVAIDWIEQTVNEEGIQFNFAWVDGYLFPHAENKVVHDKLRKVFYI